mgnify:CR=1 FL=1
MTKALSVTHGDLSQFIYYNHNFSHLQKWVLDL